MVEGTPESKTENVVRGGQAEAVIRKEHNVLYTSGAKTVVGAASGQMTWNVTYCVETPSPEVCDRCAYEFNCEFAKSKRTLAHKV